MKPIAKYVPSAVIINTSAETIELAMEELVRAVGNTVIGEINKVLVHDDDSKRMYLIECVEKAIVDRYLRQWN